MLVDFLSDGRSVGRLFMLVVDVGWVIWLVGGLIDWLVAWLVGRLFLALALWGSFLSRKDLPKGFQPSKLPSIRIDPRVFFRAQGIPTEPKVFL